MIHIGSGLSTGSRINPIYINMCVCSETHRPVLCVSCFRRSAAASRLGFNTIYMYVCICICIYIYIYICMYIYIYIYI